MRLDLTPINLVLALLLSVAAARAGDEIVCQETEEAITLLHGERPILRYNKALQTGPEGTDPVYHRSGYIHPVYTPSGKVISGDFCADHPHQHGVFFAWTNTTFEGRSIDFWNQRKQQGRVSHQEVLATKSDATSGMFQVRLLHEDITNPEKPIPVLHEVWTVRAFAAGDTFVFEIDSRQECASEYPLRINEYHYGAMAFRGTCQWMDEERVTPIVKAWSKALKSDPNTPAPQIENLPRDYLTSEGKRWHNGNHTRPNWVSMWGRLENTPHTVSILAHPSNYRFPQPVRLHPSKPYFCFAPQIEGSFLIEPGKTYQSRFRFVIAEGTPDEELLNTQWSAFAEP